MSLLTRVGLAMALLAGLLTGCGAAVDGAGVTLVIGSPCKLCLHTLLTASEQDRGTSYQIRWADFDSATPLMEAMNAGHVDIAWAGEVGVLFGVGNGARVKLLAGGVSAPEGQSRILVKDGSPVRTVRDLKGRRVAMPFYTVPHYPLAKAFEDSGLTLADVDLVNLDTVDALAAFNKGEVDALAIWDPNAAVVQTQYGARSISDLGNVVNPATAYFASDAAATDPAKAHALTDLTGRVVRAFDWANTHQAEWATRMAEIANLPPPAASLAAQRFHTQLAPIDDAIVATWQQEADFFHGLGQYRQAVRARDLVDADFAHIVSTALTTTTLTSTAPGMTTR